MFILLFLLNLFFMYIKSFIPALFFLLSNQGYTALDFSDTMDSSDGKEKKRLLEESSFSEKENAEPNTPLLKSQKITQESEKILTSNQELPVGFSADLLEFEKQSRHQYAETLFKIGCHFEGGKGVPQDFGQAFSYYVKAANLDYISAFHNLGCFYSSPDYGVEINYPKAIQYFQYALKNGCVLSAYNLGVLFAEGKGCAQNYKTAFDYFKVAEENGCEESYNTAFDYLSRAEEKGDEEDLYLLGLCYAEGIGVVSNAECAFTYFSKAAEKGYGLALFKVGLCHYHGQGTDKNDLMALDFMMQARRLGIKEAEIFLQEYTQRASTLEKKKTVSTRKKTVKILSNQKKPKQAKKK
ncbi:MAG: hypothetical protein C0432_02885 [Candidatus Puniceispirillum sp.]|nr:hypothetical protein [Candidatus Pelagibacter sp.]MBA4283222.1 hypothetical protein [Candidatus Puniceispirillum sp.]